MSMRVNMQALTTPATGIVVGSIQTILATMSGIDAGNLVIKDETITPVDMSKTIMFHNGTAGEYGSLDSDNAWTSGHSHVRLIDSSTVRFQRLYSYNYDIKCSATILEFSTGIKSLQRGLFKYNTGSAVTYLTINAVDLSKSFLNVCGSILVKGGGNTWRPRAYLSDSTTVTLECFGSSPTGWTMTMSYEIIEFE